MKKWKTKSGYEIFRILSGRSNVFLLTNDDKNILIDTSVSGSWEKIQRQIANIGIHDIDYLILTHAHFDHAANANKIKEKFKATVIVHKDDAEHLSNGSNVMIKGTNFFTRFIVNIFGKSLLKKLRYKPCNPDLLVDAVYDLNKLGLNAYLLHTPGHTHGSVSLVIDEEIAIVGDTMFGIFRWSVFPPFAEDRNQMIMSWRKLLKTKCSVFLPSHGTERDRTLLQRGYNKKLKYCNG